MPQQCSVSAYIQVGSTPPLGWSVGCPHSASRPALIRESVSALGRPSICSWAIATCRARSASMRPQAAGSFQSPVASETCCLPSAAHTRTISIAVRPSELRVAQAIRASVSSTTVRGAAASDRSDRVCWIRLEKDERG